jgi:uncharacterized protein (DUF1501 family)
VAPFGEQRYAELRASIGVRAPANMQGGPPGIDLDGFFCLHPQLDMLKPLWEKQQLAIIHAAGSPDPSRSHFDAQDYMESGTPGEKGSGWLNRALPPPTADSSPLRAISMGPQLPRTLRGDRSAIAVGNMQQYKMDDDTSAILESMYQTTADAQVGAAGKDAFSAMKMIDSVFGDRFPPRNPQQYGGGEFGNGLQQVGKLIKADVGVEAAFVEIGGWDHHQNEQQQLPGFSSARRSPGSARIWATAWRTSCSSPCRSSDARRRRMAITERITGTAA